MKGVLLTLTSDIARSLFEDYSLIPVQQNAVLDVPADRAGEHHFLEVAPFLHKLLQRIAVRDARHTLLDDRPVVQYFRHVVGRRSDQLYPTLKRLMMRLCPNERRQERMMNIDDLLRILLDEILRKHLHITR